VIRGAIAGTVHRTSAGNTYLDVDDGSGGARVFVSPRAGVAMTELAEGTWVEVIGVLGQDTTSQQPTRGYRVWPRDDADVRVLAQPVAGSESDAFAAGRGSHAGGSAGIGGAANGERREAGLGLTIPRLVRATATASPGEVVAGPALGREAEGEARTGDLGAAGLLLAGVLLLGTAGLAARQGFLERIRSTWLPLAPEGEDGAEPDAGMRLVPLTVLDGGPGEARPPGAAPPKGGRILPPT
jgi:hypothetical protein